MAEGDDDKDQIIQRLTHESAEHRRKRGEAEAKVTQLEEELARQPQLIETAKEQGKAEGAAEARAQLGTEHAQEIASAEVRAVAARTLADPDDAARFIDMTKVIKDGKVDREAIDTELAALVERKPYLAVPASGGSGDGGGKPTGNGDGGQRQSTPPGDAQMDEILRQAVKR